MGVLNRFTDWYHGNNELEKEPPKKGLKRVGYLLLNYSGKLIVVNFLFIICCIPVITIPAAITALNRYVGKIYRVGYDFDLSEYWREFKTSVWKTLPLGILNGGLLFYGYYLLSLANNFGRGTLHDIVIGLGIGVLIVGVLLGSYSFVMASMLDLSNRDLLKNTFILMIAEWKASLLLVVCTFAYVIILLAIAPHSLVIMVLCGFSMLQLMICAQVIPVIQRRILDPYEQKLKASTCADK